MAALTKLGIGGYPVSAGFAVTLLSASAWGLTASYGQGIGTLGINGSAWGRTSSWGRMVGNEMRVISASAHGFAASFGRAKPILVGPVTPNPGAYYIIFPTPLGNDFGGQDG